MKCEGCDKLHVGIRGLMPHKIPSQGLGQRYEMLCKDCMKERSEQAREYKRASRGA